MEEKEIAQDTHEDIWGLLIQPLEASIKILTVKGKKKVSLVAPSESDFKIMIESHPDPSPPKKTLKGTSKKDSREYDDPTDPEYIKAISEHALLQTYIMLDLGLKVKPAGETFEDRLPYYKKLPTPVVGILVGAIQMLMLHQIPPEDFDELITQQD
jgi:hypothetical protein